MSTYHCYFYSYLFVFIPKTITLNLSILHNFIHILHIYYTEFYTRNSLNFMVCTGKASTLNHIRKDVLFPDGS
jgi:hypothetical protein